MINAIVKIIIQRNQRLQIYFLAYRGYYLLLIFVITIPLDKMIVTKYFFNDTNRIFINEVCKLYNFVNMSWITKNNFETER